MLTWLKVINNGTECIRLPINDLCSHVCILHRFLDITMLSIVISSELEQFFNSNTIEVSLVDMIFFKGHSWSSVMTQLDRLYRTFY